MSCAVGPQCAILDDIQARRGVVVIDPKGDLVFDLLDRIPTGHVKWLTIIDPDQPAGTTLNPLQGDDHDLVVDNIVSIFGRIFAKHWGRGSTTRSGSHV